ncbi:hypothetical protein [Streptomyces sp. MAI_2237]
MIDVVAEYLAEREALLVLDTCEHLTDACALAAEALLRAAPGPRILATSRCRLGMTAEEALTVEPLPVPENDTATGPADALTLLTERAAEAVPALGLAQQQWNTLGQPQLGLPARVAEREKCEREARGAIGPAAYETAYDEGRTLAWDMGVAYALGH